eukprot:NODE_66_length_25735_cov_0.318497.p20 type:complete len:147 gc:universal NODE_66_length_25735_cov_0.318497:14136-13696(-)
MSIFLLVGENKCGKSTFIRNYFNQLQSESYATVGIDFGRFKKGPKWIEFWEIAGFENNLSYKRIAEPFLETHLSCIDILYVIFDASEPSSLGKSLKYMDWLHSHKCEIKEMKLIGTKTDLGIHPAFSATNCIYTNYSSKIQLDIFK